MKRKVITLPDGSTATRMTLDEVFEHLDRLTLAMTDEMVATYQESVDRGPIDPKDSVLHGAWCGNDPRLARR